MSNSNNGTQLMEMALKKETQKGFFSGPKLDEAYELYVQAANSYKLSKDYIKAGEAFYKAALVAEKQGEKFEASQQYINSAKAYKTSSPKEACEVLKLAVKILCENGRFHAAANHQKEIAQLYEVELNNIKGAVEAYELAAEWYSAEDSIAISNSCKLKAADLSAYTGEYKKAIDIYEEVARLSSENQLTKWSVKEYYFKSGLCQICSQEEVNSIKLTVEKYGNLSQLFLESREYRFLIETIDSLENDDIENFNNLVASYDSISRFDDLKTKLLLKVKDKFDEDVDLT